jgi:AraC-like DNA-binding protein/mannose-6-phosphate isomerase-like protein (cupin superfamily)
MPQKRQTFAVDHRQLGQLESLPLTVVAHGRDLASGDTLAFHRHRRAQLVYASDGVMTVTTRSAAYLVPPLRAVWMPGGVEHQIEARSAVSMRTLYIEPAAASALPTEIRVLNITPLLRELIIAAVANGNRYASDSPAARIMPVILDQIQAQPVASLALPIPGDARLRRLTRALLDDPADRRSLGEWSKVVGASKRTLIRLFPEQTGMTFRAWRQQRRLLRALELLSSGADVTSIALDVGYDNSSAFISMFRRCLGTTPLQYLRNAN